MSASAKAPESDRERTNDLVCHCRRVTYGRVQAAIENGEAVSLPGVQRTTTACTRCFGCRFELERMLAERLGDAYVRTTFVGRPDDAGDGDGPGRTTSTVPKRMYMPVLHEARGSSVRTRVVIFHWHEGDDEAEPVALRADLLALDGRRLSVWNASVAPGTSAVLDTASMDGIDTLPDGMGTLKLVVESNRVGSLRPYFHFVSAGGVTSTHEKSSPRRESDNVHDRRYFWVFPFGAGPRTSEAYFYAANAVTRPVRDREFVLNCTDGLSARAPMPDLELDQAVMEPLHGAFPALRDRTRAGTVRVDPAAHLAGHIIRYEPEVDRWRVQHL